MSKELMNIPDGLLKVPGDKASVEIKERSIVKKVYTDGGKTKRTQTFYPSTGTIHETRTIKK